MDPSCVHGHIIIQHHFLRDTTLYVFTSTPTSVNIFILVFENMLINVIFQFNNNNNNNHNNNNNIKIFKL